ncbi:MAG: hypothetical protein KIS61_09435 [Candidatus Eremiobacteraeota bacterium]|nr:hypothetical protein [Candidatus Eremiobacteraeota bacterium]
MHYWRVGFKGSEQPVLSLSEFGEDKTRLSYVETITHGYWIDAERLKNAEWIITWMCQLDEKSWVTAQSLREFFKIMRAFDLAHHYY